MRQVGYPLVNQIKDIFIGLLILPEFVVKTDESFL